MAPLHHFTPVDFHAAEGERAEVALEVFNKRPMILLFLLGVIFSAQMSTLVIISLAVRQLISCVIFSVTKCVRCLVLFFFFLSRTVWRNTAIRVDSGIIEHSWLNMDEENPY